MIVRPREVLDVEITTVSGRHYKISDCSRGNYGRGLDDEIVTYTDNNGKYYSFALKYIESIIENFHKEDDK